MSAITTNLARGGLVSLAAGIVFVITVSYSLMGWHSAFISGWILAATVSLLVLYRPLRRLSVLPIAPNALWTACHLFLGWFAVALFLIHIDFRWPDGVLETSLAILFLLAALSGFLGQWLNSVIPQYLSLLREEFIMERIPEFAARIGGNADNLVELALEARKESPIADYYFNHLQSWIRTPRLVGIGVISARRRLSGLMRGAEGVSRNLSESELSLVDELLSLIEQKHELDLCYSYQWLLKSWLLVHVPVSLAMMVVMAVHAVVNHAYSGM